MKGVVAQGVKEIWLSSEDTGAYGAPVNLFFWNLFLGYNVFSIVLILRTLNLFETYLWFRD